SSAAFSKARVSLIGMRLPTPYFPPVQPVLTNPQSAPPSAMRFLSRFPYTDGGRGMNAAPKQVLKVAVGSVTPISVPATLAVEPDRRVYSACAGVSCAIGGSTPNASAVRKMMVDGGGPRFFSLVFGMNSIG